MYGNSMGDECSGAVGGDWVFEKCNIRLATPYNGIAIEVYMVVFPAVAAADW